MPASKYKVSTLCLSCNKRITRHAVVITTNAREDDYEPRAYLLHEACQSAMLLKLTFVED